MTKQMKKTAVRDIDLAALPRIATGILLSLFLGILTATAFLQTTEVRIVKEGGSVTNAVTTVLESFESIIYHADNPVINIIALVLAAEIFLLLRPLMKKLSERTERIIILLWTLVIGCIWVHCSQSLPSEDSMRITSAAVKFSNGETGILADHPYFQCYPFQLGYTLFCEIIIRLLKLVGLYDDLMCLEYVNVVLLAAAGWALHKLTCLLYKDTAARHLTTLLFITCLPPIMTCSFIYGIIPGLCFSCWAMYFTARFIQAEKLRSRIIYGCVAVLLTGIAVVMKNNCLIVMIAEAVTVIAACGIKGLKRSVPFVAAAAAVSMIFPSACTFLYEYRDGTVLGDAMPYICWLDLGMTEANNAPGWYNARSYTAFKDCGLDAQKATENAKEHLAGRKEAFLADGQYTNDFFSRKFLSQWNETTYESIWNNIVRLQKSGKSGIAKWICGDGEKAAAKYIDLHAQFVFLCALAGVVLLLREKEVLRMMMPMTVLGGMMFHLLFEAKSQYSVPYSVMMLSFAGYGGVRLMDWVKTYLKNRKKSPAANDTKKAATEAEAAAENAEKPEIKAESKKAGKPGKKKKKRSAK